jgi:hypothetical protein
VFLSDAANPFLAARLLLRGVDLTCVFLRGAPAHVRECPVQVCKVRLLDLLNQLLSDGRRERDEATYGHLSRQGFLMKFKDILKTKQLSLTIFVVLDTLKISTPTSGLAIRVGIVGELPDLVWMLASYPIRICCCLYTCRAYISSSIEPAPSNRNTSTSRDCPIRKARSIACRS